MFSLALAIVASTATGEMSVATVLDVQFAAMKSEMIPQPPRFRAFWRSARVHRLDIANEKFGTRVGQRMVDPRRDVNDQAVGANSLRNGLAAHERFVSRGDVELRRAHQIGDAELAKNGGPRLNPALDVEVLDIHVVRLFSCRRKSLPDRPKRAGATTPRPSEIIRLNVFFVSGFRPRSLSCQSRNNQCDSAVSSR